VDLLTTWRDDFRWLDLIVHFPLHPCLSPEKPN
jgi:hypothetical protein